MNIKFKKIHIQSFLSIGDATIDLQNSGYTLVEGVNLNTEDNASSNGSGKSSLFEAIVWALTGDTIRGSKSVENIYTDDSALVDLYFDVDGKEYHLQRGKSDSSGKNTLKIWVDNDDKSGKGIRDTEKVLHELLPDLTAQLVGSVIVLGQGMPARFTSNTPAGRKDVLETLSKSDYMIQDIKDRISNRKLTLQKKQRDLEDELLSLQTEKDVCEKLLNKSKNELAAYQSEEQYKKKIEECNLLLEDYKNRFHNAQEEQQELSSKLIEAKDRKHHIQVLRSDELSKLKERYAQNFQDIESSIVPIQVQLSTLEAQIEAAENVKDVCPTCGQKIVGITKIDTKPLIQKHLAYELELEKVKQDKAKLIEQQSDEENEIYARYQEEDSNIDSSLVELNSRYDEVSKLTVELNSSIQSLEKDKQSAEVTLSSIVTIKESLIKTINDNALIIQDIQKKVDKNTSVLQEITSRIDIVNKFDTLTRRDFRGELLRGVISYIQNKAKEYCRDIFETDAIQFELVGNNIEISYNNKAYENLSGGERQKVDLIIQFSLRDMLCNYLNFNSSILVLDEIFDNLDSVGCNKVINLITNRLHSIESVYIISHHEDDLQIPVDNCIKITKLTSGVSVVS